MPQTRVNIEEILNPETIRKAHASKAYAQGRRREDDERVSQHRGKKRAL